MNRLLITSTYLVVALTTLGTLQARAQTTNPVKFKCHSTLAELVLVVPNQSVRDAIGISFGLASVHQTMSAEESKPRLGFFGSILVFTEKRSGLRFIFNSNFEPAKFSLELHFGDGDAPYTTIETGTCEVI